MLIKSEYRAIKQISLSFTFNVHFTIIYSDVSKRNKTSNNRYLNKFSLYLKNKYNYINPKNTIRMLLSN